MAVAIGGEALPREEQDCMAQELGIGLIGYGAIGRVHALCLKMLPMLYPSLPLRPKIVAVASGSTTSTERARQELGDIFVTTDYRELLQRDDIAVIDCCTPTGQHAEVAMAVLQAGKQLLCEKPLAATGAEAQAIAQLANERGLGGGVTYHLRFIPAIQEARRLIEGGLLGELHSFHLHYYRASNLQPDRPLTWRFAGPGSGVLQDLGSHLLDLVNYLFGPIARVNAQLRTVVPTRLGPEGKPVPVNSDDSAMLQLKLQDGALGTIEASKVVPGAADDIRIMAYGSQGSLVFDTLDPNGLLVVDGPEAAVGGRRISTLSFAVPQPVIIQAEKASGSLQWYLSTFEACCRASLGETTRLTSFSEAAHVQQVIDAAFASAAADGAWVTV